MPSTGFFSLAQLAGYAALLLGVYSFLQKDDRRLKATVGAQALTYAAHFFLLGSTAAGAAALVTSLRALLSLVTKSRRVAGALLVTIVVLGLITVENAVGWLPIVAASAGTIAFFWFEGIAMRVVLLAGTACWLANNLLLGSIGGTLLELFLGAVNGSTCYRLWRDGRHRQASELASP